MKATLLFLAVIFLTSSTQCNQFQQHIVNQFNAFRREFSIGLQIANMQELKYDIDLENEAKSFTKCEEIKNGPGYRVTFERFLNFTLDIPDARRIKEHAHDRRFIVYVLPYLHPLQSYIACVNLLVKCPIPGQPINALADNVCLFGPKTTDPESEFKYGKPRSQCVHGKADSGLCKGESRV